MSKRTTIRIPDDLYEQIAEYAKKDQRTISNVVVLFLRHAVQDRRLVAEKSQSMPQVEGSKSKGKPV